MPGFILHMKIRRGGLADRTGLKMSQIRRETMRALAEHWHRVIFPRHFGASNRSAYGLTPRNRVYVDVIKKRQGQGVGRFRDEVLSGQSARWMQSFYKIVATARRVTVSMFPPSYFTNPFVGTFTDPRTGRRKQVTRQPDKPDEVTRFNQSDRRELRQFAGDHMQKLIRQSRSNGTTTTAT